MIIGLSAKMGCGKTTVADMLLERIGGVKLSFAGVLKRECAEYLGFPVEWCFTQEGKGKLVESSRRMKAMTVREALQWYGTDYRRAQDPGYWLKAMDAEAAKYPTGHIIIDDVRFPNEADWCRERGLCIRLEPYGGYSAGEAGHHISETALDEYLDFDAIYSPRFGELLTVVEAVTVIVAEYENLKAEAVRA